uniref:Reverse transcriptase domain-containing protein n=1 Tax=Tanacetum cinerariifolium TaxID=118510 RepID=A0A6L2L174_TANCI|nr:reverse transcriptase domain-containing protein [Tanacetum cinerariifolium]
MPELSPVSYWLRPGYNKTDMGRSQAIRRLSYARGSRKGRMMGNADMVPHVQFYTYWIREGPVRNCVSQNTHHKQTSRAQSHPTYVRRVKHIGKRERANLKNPDRNAFDAALWEYCDKHYHKLLPIIAEKVHQEKVQLEKLKQVKARLNFEGCSGKNSKVQEVAQHSEIRRDRPESPRNRPGRTGRRDIGVFNRFGSKEKSVSARSESRNQSYRSRRMKPVPKRRYREGTSSRKTNPFTPRICYFELSKKTQMLNNIKTDDRCDDPEDHLKFFQATVKVERWAMPTWCHMFKSTLAGSARVWFDDLPSESIDSYDDLKKAFLENYLQQNKCIKDPVEIHHIKQREGESTEDFMQRFKAESRHVKGAPECTRISGFMHGITNPELIKRLHNNIPKSVDEMMRVTTTFLREMWQLLIKHGRKHFRHGSNRKHEENKILTEEEISGISRGEEDGMEGPMIIEASSGSKKPNGFGYRTPHWFQWRSYMANATNIAANKNIGCGTFNLHVDEFRGGEIKIFVQWDHRKAMGKENSSSTIDTSWNAKVPSSRRNTYSAEQQDNSNLMHDGLRTGSTDFQHRSDSRRKNQGVNSSRIPRANNCNRLHPNRGRTKGIMRLTQTQP